MIPKTVSVIIPAYNAERTIVQCLQAIKQQSLPALEVIVVDDGSKDLTVELAKKLAVVIASHRKGAGGARNTGVYAARGDIVVFTDSDCIPNPDWLKKISDAFKEETVVAVAGGYSDHRGEKFIGKFAFWELSRRRKNMPLYVETAVSNNFAVRSEVFKKVGGFAEFFEGATLEDMVFSFQVSRIGKVRWLQDNGVSHYFHETLRGYLQQQFAFGRDTVVVYKKIPALLSVKTHQGRLIYFETLIAGLVIFSLFRPWSWFAIGVCILWCLNFKLLGDVFKYGGPMMFVQALCVIIVRDFNMVLSVVAGCIKIMTQRNPIE